jgi:small subunit ribosomal protein S16
MQRTGRKGHAMFRVVVQDSRLTPTSGKVVATLGSYDPHMKTARLDTEKASFYLNNGAQPSDRAALLLKKEGVKLPGWVKVSPQKSGKIRNPEKLRRNNPVETPQEEAPAEEPAAEAAESPVEEVAAAESDPAAETGTVES